MADAEATRQRILQAAYDCVARRGLTGLTMDDTAQEAALSRATVYRYFPGGRDQLVDEVITWEIGRFFDALRGSIDDSVDFASRLEQAIAAAYRALEHHDVLQHVLQTEADQLLPSLATVMPIVHAVLRDELAEQLRGERLRQGVDADQAADYLARVALSLIGSPGAWDLTEPAAVRALVRDKLLAGILG